MPTKLERGIQAAKARELETARRLLAESVAEDPNNERVWLWLTAVTDEDRERRVFLKQVLRINPDSEPARRGLARLDARQVQAVPPFEPLVNGREVELPDQADALTSTDSILLPEEEPPDAYLGTQAPTEPILPSKEEPPASYPETQVPTQPILPSEDETLVTAASEVEATTEPILPSEDESLMAAAAEVQAPTEPVALPMEAILPDADEGWAAAEPVLADGAEALAPTPPDAEPEPRFAPGWGAGADEPEAAPGLGQVRTEWPSAGDDERPRPDLWQPIAPSAPPSDWDLADEEMDLFEEGPPSDHLQRAGPDAASRRIGAGHYAAPLTASERPAQAAGTAVARVSPLLYAATGLAVCLVGFVIVWLAFPSVRESLESRLRRAPAETAVVGGVPTPTSEMRPMLESNVTVVSAFPELPASTSSRATPLHAAATAAVEAQTEVVEVSTETVEGPTAGPQPSPSAPEVPATPVVEASPQVLPPPTVPEPVAWIVAYVSQSPTSGTVHYLSRLQRLASARRVEFQVLLHEAGFLQAIQQPSVTAAFYGGMASTEALWALADLVDRGGHALLLYNEAWQSQNELLGLLFGVNVAAEQVAASENTFFYPPTMLPPWLAGLDLGLRQEGGSFALESYLVATDPSGVWGEVLSQTSGAKRLMFYVGPEATVGFWPAVTGSVIPDGPEILDHFFGDRSIERFSNLAGAGRMLDWLSGLYD